MFSFSLTIIRTRILGWLVIQLVFLLPNAAMTSPQSTLSDHAKEILIRGAGSLDSLTVLWSDTGGTGSQILLARRYGAVIEIVRERSVLIIDNPFGFSAEFSSLVIQQDLEFLHGPWSDNYSQLSAAATHVHSDGSIKHQWSFSEEADEAEYDGDYYVTTEHNCCEVRPVHRAHRLSDGNAVMNYQSELYSFDSAQGSKASGVNRFIAIYTPVFWEREVTGPDSTFIAFVYYASKDSLLHIAKILFTGPSSFSVGDGGPYHEPYYWPWTIGDATGKSIDSLRGVYPQVCTSAADLRGLTTDSERILLLTVNKEMPAFVIGVKDDSFIIEPSPEPGYRIVKVR